LINPGHVGRFGDTQHARPVKKSVKDRHARPRETADASLDHNHRPPPAHDKSPSFALVAQKSTTISEAVAVPDKLKVICRGMRPTMSKA